ncbi:MAG: BirA family transcriptional regulator [Acidimicrobiaceae bacterium]|nr:BirA family transcriptional regulator [Acidimicrobiaceae bacterium]
MDEPTKRRLASSTRFGDIRELVEVDSTNRYLMDLARTGAPEGVVVVADFQSAGRGRRGRTWEAPAGGALLASILLRPLDGTGAPATGPGTERRWLAPAAVALAAADACTAVSGAGGVVPAIKWPNDLLLGDAKLAGILAEADAGAIVVGIGINVSSAPAGAASLGAAVDRGGLLAGLLDHLERWCDRWDEVAPAYLRRCATVGRQVRVETPDGAVVGRAEAVEADGRLRVLVSEPAAGPVAPGGPAGGGGGGEVRWFSAGEVVHLRAAGGPPG